MNHRKSHLGYSQKAAQQVIPSKGDKSTAQHIMEGEGGMGILFYNFK